MLGVRPVVTPAPKLDAAEVPTKSEVPKVMPPNPCAEELRLWARAPDGTADTTTTAMTNTMRFIEDTPTLARRTEQESRQRGVPRSGCYRVLSTYACARVTSGREPSPVLARSRSFR